ncbi:unnamed protein product [marine sediment metagenome]|uniref:Uncharacterized protein n=1 Tax=marine sediment metagenome TaxID=412755 RepID=X1G3B8_9ZZZZ
MIWLRRKKDIYITDDIPDIEQAILATIDDYFKSNPINPFPSRIKSITNFQISTL